MVHQKLFAVGVLGWVMAGCTVQAEGTTEGVLGDPKPEDGSEFAGNQLGSAQQPHTQHYTDGTNLWQETGYKMGTDNPNCKDWNVWDNYWVKRPAAETWGYTSTFNTNHAWAKGSLIDPWMAQIPNSLGYSDGYRHILVDHNSVVARANGMCSGRYVFQMDNQSEWGVFDFAANRYWFAATLPYWTMPRNKAACHAREVTSVPYIFVDLYACEAWDRRSVAGRVDLFCSKGRGNWRKVGSASHQGWWNETAQKCEIATGVEYVPPTGKIAVSFNMVIKAGVGHGVAPADIQIYRYN
jgi:hypothetical protein